MVKAMVGSRYPARDAFVGLTMIAAAVMSAGHPAKLAAQAPGDEVPLRVGVINLDAVALQSPSGQALQQEIAAFQRQLTTELQTRQAAARAIEARVAESDSLSLDEQRLLEREYQDALTEFQRFQQDKQEEATLLRDDGLARIQEEIAPVIETIQAELGYDLVLNSQSTDVVIFSERIDITRMVIDRLQAAGPGG